LAGVLFAPSILRSQARQALQNFFKDSQVSVGTLSFELPLSLALSDIKIEHKQVSLSVKKASLNTSLELILWEPRVKFSAFPAQWFSGGENQATPFLRSVELRDLTLQSRLPGLSADIQGSLVIDPVARAIVSADLSSPSIRYKKLELKNITFRCAGQAGGQLSAALLSYDKLKVADMSGTVTMSKNALEIKPLTGASIGGKLDGSISVAWNNGVHYRAALDLTALELGAFTREFELEKKMSASGKLAGKIALEGSLSGIQIFSGDFSGTRDGGDLVIQDQDFLNTLAKNVHQPVVLVEAGFKEYHFDTARLSLELDKRDLNFLIALNGEKGKRDLEIKLHDLFQSGG
jgi:hypothetical protein